MSGSEQKKAMSEANSFLIYSPVYFKKKDSQVLKKKIDRNCIVFLIALDCFGLLKKRELKKSHFYFSRKKFAK